MLFEAIPLLFFYLFTSVFSGAKCSIAAISSGLQPLFHSMEFLLPAFLRTADPGLLFFQENSFCTCFVFYRNHKNRTYKRNLNDLVQEFDISSSRTKWQLCQIICVPAVLCIAELCNMPRAMWAGIAAMSAILPFMEDMQYRVRKRIVGNIAGVICFTVLYFLLPSSIYTYIGILGGIGVGLSAKYGWQAVFNTFGALAIATESYGLKGAVGLRVIQNVFGVVFALIFCSMFYWLMSKKKETVVTVAAK